MPIDPWSICVYAVALAALWAVHGGLVLRGRLRRRRRVEAEGPRCAGCGYILYGGAVAVCPECGRACAGDQYEAEAPPRPVSPVPAILSAWVVLFPPVVGAAYPVAAAFPGVWVGRGWATVSTPYGDAYVWGSVRGRWAEKRAWHCDVRLPLRVDARYYGVDLVAMTMTARGLNNPPPAVAVDPAAIAREFAEPGQATADPAAVRAAEEVAREIRDLRDGRWEEGRFQYEMAGRYLVNLKGGGERWFWLPSYVWACVPVWVGVGLLVTRGVARRWRAKTAAYERAREVWLSRAAEACLPSPAVPDGG